MIIDSGLLFWATLCNCRINAECVAQTYCLH